MKTYRELLKEGKDRDLEKAKKKAAKWSLDDENNIGQAVITNLGGKYSISSDVSAGVEIFAKFIDGKEVSESAGGKNLILHVWKNHNGSFYVETQKDDVIGDNFDTAYDALKWAGKMYPKATIYKYEGK
jgi:hypothetical protein